VRPAVHHHRRGVGRDGGPVRRFGPAGRRRGRGGAGHPTPLRRRGEAMTSNGLRALIVEHERASPGGLIQQWLESRGAAVDVYRIDVEDRTVDPADYDLIVSLGSEFAAFDQSLPFLEPEEKLMRQALDADVPILGVCFGGQLLARVLGGEGFRAEKAEIGWVTVRSRDPDLIPEGPWFEWHFDSFTL